MTNTSAIRGSDSLWLLIKCRQYAVSITTRDCAFRELALASTTQNDHVRYEPNETPSPGIAIGAGLQAATLIVTPIVLTVVIVARIAEQPESYMAWGVFAALIISGLTTILQVVRFGRIGSGYVLVMGTSAAFIAVCVAALVEAGPATMAALIIISSLFQFLLAYRLSWLRRVFTPTVAGTVIMLVAATVMPILFDSFGNVPDGTDDIAAPVVILATLITVGVLVLRGPSWLRLWSPAIGVIVGCIVGAPFGLYDIQQVADADWIGVPFSSWPGIDVTPGIEFWALLPAFIIVTIIGAIETIGDGVAIQRVSHRNPKATDFRVVQGALNTDGVGNLLSGLLGTLPNTTYSTSISLAEVTGVAARRVGIVIGIAFIALAFFPKITALIIAIPEPVAAAYILVLIALLFLQGMRIVIQDGLDYRKALIVGLSFWVGVGFQNQWVFPELLGDGFLGVFLGNGMTSGSIVAIVAMVFMEITAPRRKRIRLELNQDALPQLTDFLRSFASSSGWNEARQNRIALVGEEILSTLLNEAYDPAEDNRTKHLIVAAHAVGSQVELEFIAASEGENIEDRLSYLGETPDIADDREISFRLLRHYASSIHHQKYHGIDIVTVNVERGY
ncbi:MAG: hypothetical protein F4Y63_04175 [Chloroflexi bacterium]|nr:hypothetical protein [Chloroflexota bacterium]MYK61311.1 hypothetical protein [Chloroflexota bacterium]